MVFQAFSQEKRLNAASQVQAGNCNPVVGFMS